MAKKRQMDSMMFLSAIYIYNMSNVQRHGSNRFDSQMQMHSGNQINDVRLAK